MSEQIWIITGESGHWADFTTWAAGIIVGTEDDAKYAVDVLTEVALNRDYEDLEALDPNLCWMGHDSPSYSYELANDLNRVLEL